MTANLISLPALFRIPICEVQSKNSTIKLFLSENQTSKIKIQNPCFYSCPSFGTFIPHNWCFQSLERIIEGMDRCISFLMAASVYNNHWIRGSLAVFRCASISCFQAIGKKVCESYFFRSSMYSVYTVSIVSTISTVSAFSTFSTVSHSPQSEQSPQSLQS